ncbi:hypothetical protein [Stenotrophomonas sp. PS02298]|uniref:hypothetical protein n=1 Tax=Stenotrophomonas sp. PS02298 TaxID=2991424 RepID=UPI00249ACFA3|nr:hypothetical protein [Stenotrophomonas sp. PS02298]
MTHLKKPLAIAASLLFFVCTEAAAQRDTAIDVHQPFAEQRQKILDDLRGEKYSEISSQNKDSVLNALERIGHNAGNNGEKLSELPESSRVAVFNDQSLINSILSDAGEDSRLICRREKAVGSRLADNHCMTVAERRRQRNTAQDDMTRARRTMKTTN